MSCRVDKATIIANEGITMQTTLYRKTFQIEKKEWFYISDIDQKCFNIICFNYRGQLNQTCRSLRQMLASCDLEPALTHTKRLACNRLTEF
jgi:hypothetical protein